MQLDNYHYSYFHHGTGRYNGSYGGVSVEGNHGLITYTFLEEDMEDIATEERRKCWSQGYGQGLELGCQGLWVNGWFHCNR